MSLQSFVDKKSRSRKSFLEYNFSLASLLKENKYSFYRRDRFWIRKLKKIRRLPAESAVTLFTLSIRGALRSLHLTCLSLLPCSTSFIMLAQSGRFLGLDFSASSFCICVSLSGGRSLRIVLPGGGGGGRGGGGGGTFARDELFDKVGAPWCRKFSLFIQKI